jgi:hypothetical protein
MKKTLLYLLMGTSFVTTAQTLVTENFNSLVAGDVSTEITGSTAGQGSYFLFSTNGTAPTTSTNAGVTNAQIVAGGNASLGLQITGPNGDKGSRFMWKDGFPALWTARTAGNNIIELEVDINPGAGTTLSRNNIGVYIYNGAGDRVLAGVVVKAATRELFLVAYSTPTGNPVGSYTYSLAAAPGIQLPANVFSRVGISFNKTTGQVIIKAPGLAPAGAGVAGSAAGTDPGEIDFVGVSGHTTAVPNTAAGSAIMDNLLVKASSTDTLLAVDEVGAIAQFSVYPNPANDFVTISNDASALISSVEITDLNGRVVSNNQLNATEGQISLADLASGVYMLTITTDQGSTVKKIVKQ